MDCVINRIEVRPSGIVCHYWQGIIAVMFAVATMSGCSGGHKIVKPPAVTGYVNLDVLAKQTQDWRLVEQYDTIIRSAQGNVKYNGRTFRGGTAVIPVLSTINVQTAKVELQSEQTRLQRVKSRSLTELIDRLALSRERKINQKSYTWEADANQIYDEAYAQANEQYLSDVKQLLSIYDASRVNIQLRIIAAQQAIRLVRFDLNQLQTTINLYNAQLEAINPKSVDAINKLKETIKRLHGDEQRLQNHLRDFEDQEDKLTVQNNSRSTEQENAISELKAKRNQTIETALNKANSQVALQRVKYGIQLHELDSKRIVKEKYNLENQLNMVLREIAKEDEQSRLENTSLSPVSVAYKAPDAEDNSQKPAASGVVEKTKLEKQRLISHIYMTVKDAALEVAKQKNLKIAFVDQNGYNAETGAIIGRKGVDLTSLVATDLGRILRR